MSDWLEIAKRKPPEHEYVLFWTPEWTRPVIGFVSAGGVDLMERTAVKEPTHWRMLPETPIPTPPPLTWAQVDRVEPEFIETVLLWSEGWGGTFIGHRTLSSEYVDIESVPFDPQPTYWMSFPKRGPRVT